MFDSENPRVVMQRRMPRVYPPDFGLTKGAEPLEAIKPRKIRRGLPGDFPTRKGTLPSLRTKNLLEIDALGHFELNPDIALMAMRSHSIEWDDPQKDGSSILRRYVPSLAMRRRDGAVCVLDIRSAEDADTEAWRRTEAYLRIDYGLLKASFATLTEESVYIQPRHRNVSQMLQMRMVERDEPAIDRVRTVVHSLLMPAAVGVIVAKAKLPNPHGCADPAFACLVEMAITGEVELDLSRPLGIDTRVSIPARRYEQFRRLN